MLLLLLAVAALGAPADPTVEAPTSPPARATAPLPAAPLPGAAANPPPGEDKIVCRKEQELGTRFPRKVCRTESSIRRMQDDSRKVTQDIQTNAGMAPR